MSHQPYENWIIAGEHLPPDEQSQLNQHIADCPQCRQLKCSLHAVQTRLANTAQAAPAEGFTNRWLALRQARLAEQQSRQILQVRRFFLFMGTALILSLMLLIGMLLTGGNWLDMLTNAANRLSTFNQWFVDAQDFMFILLQITPPALPVALWIVISSVFCILALVWIVSIWRITAQGAKSR